MIDSFCIYIFTRFGAPADRLPIPWLSPEEDGESDPGLQDQPSAGPMLGDYPGMHCILKDGTQTLVGQQKYEKFQIQFSVKTSRNL